jgi:MoaA/NifB/PqqE/SkfB family radical SAM enzyme
MSSEMSILDRFRNTSSQKFIPLQASLELTNRCNERCTHCYIEDFSDNPQRVLTLEQWYHVLQELRAAGTFYIILMGGEAMLNIHFWDILKRSQDLNFHTSMITNGLKIQTSEVAAKLKSNGLQNATISFYSLKPEIHDSMTKVRGSHAKTLRAIDLCHEAGIQVSINCLLTKQNIEGIFAMEDWAMEKDLMLKVDPMITPKLNGNLEPTKYRASIEQLRAYYQEKLRRWPNGKPKASGETADNYTCNAGKGKCAVNAYGDLFPCIEIRDSLGNLLEKPFQELWHGEKVQPWRNLRWNQIKDANQDMVSFCEHCPGMAKNETGDAKTLTCFSKDVAKLKKELSV